MGLNGVQETAAIEMSPSNERNLRDSISDLTKSYNVSPRLPINI